MYKTIRKPTINEIITAQADLEETNILVCGICNKEDDGSNNAYINRVECCKCTIWVNTYCLGKAKDSVMSKNDHYICDECT